MLKFSQREQKQKYSEKVKDLTDRELLVNLYATQIFILSLALILSKILFKGFTFWNQIHLGDIRILTVGVSMGLVVVLVDSIFMAWLPSSYYDDGGLNEKIFRNRKRVQIVLIALLTAVSEEMLFRGIIQAKTGLIWASLLFAGIHYRYLFNWFLFLNVNVLSFFIGFIYYRTNNLAVTIAMHFTIDLLLGLLIRWRKFKE